MHSRYFIFALTLSVLGIGAARSAHAATVTSAAFKITAIETGWNGEGFVIYGGPVVNLCTNTGEYAVQASLAGYKDMLSIATAAYLAGRNVVLMYDNAVCSSGLGGRKKVVAVRIQD